MDYLLVNEIRVLAVDPSPRGIGFAVLEGPDSLVDWGIKQAGEDKNVDSLRLVGELIERFRPHVLALEDVSGDDSRRHERVRELLGQIHQLAREKRVKVVSFPPERVYLAFRPRKDVIAAAVAGRFPELQPRLPSPRQCGDSEHDSMPIFDAAAFAMAYFHFRRRRGLSDFRKALREVLG